MLENPSKTVLMSVNGIAYLFAIAALAAGIAWIYYVVKAVEDDQIGGSDGRPNSSTGNGQTDTVRVMFQGAVVSILFYFVARHHFKSHY